MRGEKGFEELWRQEESRVRFIGFCFKCVSSESRNTSGRKESKQNVSNGLIAEDQGQQLLGGAGRSRDSADAPDVPHVVIPSTVQSIAYYFFSMLDFYGSKLLFLGIYCFKKILNLAILCILIKEEN
jgi:hypothetical protein